MGVNTDRRPIERCARFFGNGPRWCRAARRLRGRRL